MGLVWKTNKVNSKTKLVCPKDNVRNQQWILPMLGNYLGWLVEVIDFSFNYLELNQNQMWFLK